MLNRNVFTILTLLWIFSTSTSFAQSDTSEVNTSDSLSKQMDSTKFQRTKKAGLTEIIDFAAEDSMIMDFETRQAYLYQKAKINTSETDLEAYYIQIDLDTKELFAKGTSDTNNNYIDKPILEDKGERFTADSMRYNSKSGKGRVYGLRMQQDQAHIHLGAVLKLNDGSFTGNQGKITTCDADDPHFYLSASTVKVIPNNKSLFGPANLVIQGIPTPVALPFGLAPLKKGQRDGILFPSLGFNAVNSSFYLQNFGYYIGLGQYSDLQINSDAYLNGDFRLGLNTQYFRRYKFRGTLGLQFSRFSNGAEETSPEFGYSNDFSIRSQFSMDPKNIPGIRLSGNINIVTSGFNQRNSRDINNLSNNQFTSSINFGKSFFNNKMNLSMAARHTQNTSNGDFRLDLPALNIGVSSLTPFASKTGSNNKWYQQIRLSYSGNWDNKINTKDSIIFSDRYKEAFASFASGLRHNIPISTNIKLFNGILNFSPSFNYRENWHLKGQLNEYDVNSNSVIKTDTSGFFRQYAYSFSTSIKTQIYGTFTNLNWGRIEALRHTITPTVNISYSPEINPLDKGWNRTYIDGTGKLVEYNLFSSSPVGNLVQNKSGFLTYGLNNNLQGKRKPLNASTGKVKSEKFNIIDQFNFSGNYNIYADSLNFSDVRSSFNTVLFKVLRINSSATYSPYYRDQSGRTINEFYFNRERGFLRFKNANLNLNARLSPDLFKDKTEEKQPKKVLAEEESEMYQISNNREAYYDFNIPWSLNLAYMVNYNNESAIASNKISTNQITFSGDISITKGWKIAFQSGYDLRSKMVAGSQFSVVRNLRCWQLEFSWVPTGYGKQWVFTLRPVSRLLQDLKLNKRVYSNPALM